ncbi:MAG: prephenate dehydrogenase/arogenate dehydrogenase family protein [Candidatus Bathyarchaeota archaeon]|nr:prephenate dehydrogenase/arogenate dehydrogenase family protein [Candidatus Bathyarchaeota archaeon]
MQVAIIGAGKMGRWFTRLFTREDYQVVVSDKNKKKLARIRREPNVKISSTREAIREADWILICVPIKNFVEVLREISSQVRPKQVVMDICSIKDFPVKSMHEYITTATILGTHPMFGPTVKSIRDQSFILTPTNTRERDFAKTFRRWLEERQARVSILLPKKHDDLMSIVLGFPHFLGVVIGNTLLSYADVAEATEIVGPSYKKLLALVKSVVSQDPEFYSNLQMRLPKTEEIGNRFCQQTMDLLKIVTQKDETAFANKMRSLQTYFMKL